MKQTSCWDASSCCHSKSGRMESLSSVVNEISFHLPRWEHSKQASLKYSNCQDQVETTILLQLRQFWRSQWPIWMEIGCATLRITMEDHIYSTLVKIGLGREFWLFYDATWSWHPGKWSMVVNQLLVLLPFFEELCTQGWSLSAGTHTRPEHIHWS